MAACNELIHSIAISGRPASLSQICCEDDCLAVQTACARHHSAERTWLYGAPCSNAETAAISPVRPLEAAAALPELHGPVSAPACYGLLAKLPRARKCAILAHHGLHATHGRHKFRAHPLCGAQAISPDDLSKLPWPIQRFFGVSRFFNPPVPRSYFLAMRPASEASYTPCLKYLDDHFAARRNVSDLAAETAALLTDPDAKVDDRALSDLCIKAVWRHIVPEGHPDIPDDVLAGVMKQVRRQACAHLAFQWCRGVMKQVRDGRLACTWLATGADAARVFVELRGHHGCTSDASVRVADNADSSVHHALPGFRALHLRSHNLLTCKQNH